MHGSEKGLSRDAFVAFVGRFPCFVPKVGVGFAVCVVAMKCIEIRKHSIRKEGIMKIHRFVLNALVCFIAVGCGGPGGAVDQSSGVKEPDPSVSDHGAASAPQVFPASEQTKEETGIAVWELQQRDSVYHAIGRDADGRSLVDFDASNLSSSCNQNNAKPSPVESGAGCSLEGAVPVSCSTEAHGRPTDSKTMSIWNHLSSDLGSRLGEPPASNKGEQNITACPPFCCEVKTDTKCCGPFMFCNDQWIDNYGNCVTSGWYICGACIGLPWCS
jgi:hypothetical protein